MFSVGTKLYFIKEHAATTHGFGIVRQAGLDFGRLTGYRERVPYVVLELPNGMTVNSRETNLSLTPPPDWIQIYDSIENAE